MLAIELIPHLNDNYAYALTDQETGMRAIVDPGEAQVLLEYCEAQDFKPDFILNTHHHGDHIAGNQALKDRYGAQLVAARADSHRIKGVDIALDPGESFSLGSQRALIIDTPGHTIGHIAFYFAGANALFCGDTLFVGGCGRVMEGTMEQMFASLQALKALPDDTRIYCGHEYTESNFEFATGHAPEEPVYQERLAQVRDIREKGQATIPSTIGLEKETNIFMRANTVEDFTKVREAKDAA